MDVTTIHDVVSHIIDFEETLKYRRNVTIGTQNIKITNKNLDKKQIYINEEHPAMLSADKLRSSNNEGNEMDDVIKLKGNVREREFLRRTKQNIQPKSESIIEHVKGGFNILQNIKGKNMNNWEDFFTADGELANENFYKRTSYKVGSKVKNVKTAENYTAHRIKQIVQLEHIVELYDFPSTLKNEDLISAFKELNSDSMYIQWIDDTHALLVLGSHTQALKAIDLSSSFIKVRPMSSASKPALEKAYRFNLKPAIKRPQTNLQTVRRLITTHLGERSRVSKEQIAREQEDIRVAKELKKKTRQNAKDAWEGNLRSISK